VNAATIAGYTYQADNFCPKHIVAQLTANPGDAGHAAAVIADPETHLDLLARLAGVDRTDEWSFDSGDFPKVILGDQVEPDDFCGAGHQLLEP
jgi:hypothetical protein